MQHAAQLALDFWNDKTTEAYHGAIYDVLIYRVLRNCLTVATLSNSKLDRQIRLINLIKVY